MSVRSAAVPYRVRPAARADLPAIVALEREAFSDPWSLRSFADLLASPAVWFAVAEGTETGTAPSAGGAEPPSLEGFVIALRAGDEAEIANIAVQPDRRGAGVGALLLDAALARVEADGAAAVFLEVRASNHAARRLYARRGFVEVGRRTRYYRNPVEDALVLRRSNAGTRDAAADARSGDVGRGA